MADNEEIDKTRPKIAKLLCPVCANNTNHQLVWTSGNIGSKDEETGVWEHLDYSVWQCLGCETPILRKEYMFSEDLNIQTIHGENIAIPEVTSWPKTNYRMLKIKSFTNTPSRIRRLYRETIEAYNAELSTLCAAGIRAVIEAVCNHEKTIADNLEKKIEALVSKGVISKDLADGLHQSRLIGNDALHENKLYGDAELQIGIELIENLLDSRYETLGKVNLLKSLIPAKDISSETVEVGKKND